jgi:glycosyltransferase involved in cell wall biosynthesis
VEIVMKAAFCYDHVFVRAGGGEIYSSGAFSASSWQRYLAVFDELVVISRCRRLGEHERLDGLNRASAPGVSFVFVPSLAGVTDLLTRRAEVRAALRSAVAGVDGVVVRLPSAIGSRAVEVARELDKPIAAEVVGCPWDALWNYGSWLGKVYAPVAAWRTRRAVRRARHVLYVTGAFLQRRYPALGKTTFASNVEIPTPAPEVLDRRLERIAAQGPSRVLGLIGSIGHRYKGVHTAIEALARLSAELPQLELRVLGGGDPGPLMALADRLGVAARVRFCGRLPGGRPVLDWLDQVDIYLQPSFQEGLPRALIEAMSRGCPAIGSTAGGIPELLEPAWRHRPGDAPALARLIRRLALDEDARAAAARRNFQCARNYGASELQSRRQAFWSAFAEQVRTFRQPTILEGIGQ